MAKKQRSDFCQIYNIQILVKNFLSGSNRSLANSRSTAKRPTALGSLLDRLTIPITLKKNYFLTKLRIFCKGVQPFFAKIGKAGKFPGLNANRLEIKQRAQRGMTFLVLTFIFNMAAKKLNF